MFVFSLNSNWRLVINHSRVKQLKTVPSVPSALAQLVGINNFFSERKLFRGNNVISRSIGKFLTKILKTFKLVVVQAYSQNRLGFMYIWSIWISSLNILNFNIDSFFRTYYSLTILGQWGFKINIISSDWLTTRM